MALRDSSINVFPKLYGTVKKTGLLKHAWAHELFRTAYFAYKRYLEDPFADLVKRHPEMFKGGDVLDIGANIGYTASIFASVLDAESKVYAFEPDVANFGELEKTAKKCGSGKILPFQYALGSESGVIDLWYNPNHHADHRVVTDALRKSLDSQQYIYQVQKTSIDDFVSQQSLNRSISFIKMDVQGYELPVCEGMVDTLSKNPDVTVAVEYFPSVMEALGFAPTELLDFFIGRGYTLYLFSRGAPLRKFDLHEVPTYLGSKGYFDFLASRQVL